MKTSQTFIIGISTLLLSAVVSSAEIKITVGHNTGDDATTQFKFSNVPSPVADDAAAKAKFTIVSGDPDDNSADITCLNDGKLPTEEDEPDANFFFASDTQGGRIQVDLGSVIAIKQVNTYSWHPNTRGPQVYKLYASDGKADGFNAKPDNDVKPEKVGWKLIAKVDTRPKDGDGGGQYGVSISDSDGVIGKYRYLLFDCSPTEMDDANGNTFYSEIDVVGADDQKAAATTAKTASVPVPLASSFNIVGIYTNGAEFSDGVDGSGYACSSEFLGASQVWAGATFEIGSPGVSNVVTAAGQAIPLPAGTFSSLRLLMMGVNGDQESQNFLVTYGDGTVQTNTQSISDWFTPEDYPGESQVVTMDHRNNSDGTSSDDQTFYVYGYTFNLNKTNAVKSVTLPDNSNVKVFAMTLVP
jgi:hypothetical protein